MSPPLAEVPQLIAVVEDDRAVLDALEFALQTQGYAVCAFEGGHQALSSSSIDEADCLVIDYAMPDMDGIALLQALRQRGLTCPAIIIASTPTPQCRKGASALHAQLLEKPLMRDVLGERIREVLGPR